MKNGLCRKCICCSNCISLKLSNVCLYIKRRWVEVYTSNGIVVKVLDSNPAIPGSKLLGDSKVNSAFHSYEVD